MFEYAQRIKNWAKALHPRSEWSAALNTAFDEIGFDESFLTDALSLPHNASNGRRKAIKDHVWGMIELDCDCLWLLDSPLMQRSRRVKQTGLTYLTYPTANQTRFDHSLGVYQVVKRLLAAARANGAPVPAADSSSLDADVPPIKPEFYEESSYQAKILRHAALLHDLGHGPYSHVSESAFMTEGTEFRIGPYTVAEFLADFKLAMSNQSGPVQVAQLNPKLAELLTIAIITSDRFVRYYAARPGATGATQTLQSNNALDDLCNIAALILGAPIERNDLALPQILSGPVDADKIDYLQRDALACGVSTSIDVARAFLRAGVYEVSHKLLIDAHMEVRGLNPDRPVKIFLIDPSGTDAIRELSDARGSLYRRVYHHQLTRNAEAHFHAMLRSARKTEELQKYGDFLQLWAVPEDTLLYVIAGARKSAPDAAFHAEALRSRRLTRRAACFHQKSFPPVYPALLHVMPTVADARHKPLEIASAKVGKLAANGKFITDLTQECARIRLILIKAGMDAQLLPAEAEPPGLQLIPFPIRPDPTQAALLRRGDKIEQFGKQLSGYEQAGSFQIEEKQGFVTAPTRWREIAAVAFQRLLVERVEEISRADIVATSDPDKTSGTEEQSAGVVVSIMVRLRPTLNLLRSARECKLAVKAVEDIANILSSAQYFDHWPRSYPQPTTPDLLALAPKFLDFNGQHGWKIDPNGESLAAFLTQFPPRLRQSCIDQVLHGVKVLTEDRTRALAKAAIDKLRTKDKRRFLLAPLSGSSGYDVRRALEGHEPADTTLFLTLQEALDAARTDENSVVVLLDDNLSSGHQASGQLQVLFGKEKGIPGGNQFIKPLNKDEKTLLKQRGLYFALAVAFDDGMTVVRKAATTLGFRAAKFGIERGEDFAVYSSKALSSELSGFLERVGMGLVSDKLRRDDPNADESVVAQRAEQRALGYGNKANLLITPSNVPTATLTALWMPGTYVPEGDPLDPAAKRAPWVPLFIRRGYWPYLVLP